LAGTPAPVPTPIWDRATRLAHWALPLLILFLWWTAHNDKLDWHRWAGLAVLGLLVFRMAWGVLGGSTARFSQFVKGPGAGLAYLKSLFGRKAQPIVGHNPLGGWSVVALLLTLIAVAGTGLFAEDTDDLAPGPLAHFVDFDTGRLMSKLHHQAFDVLLWLIGLHLFAIVFYALVKRENLVGPMLTGRRKLPEGAGRLKPAAVWRLLFSLALAAGAVALAAWG
jgi:cytochrome b